MKRSFSLGELFTEWGVSLSADDEIVLIYGPNRPGQAVPDHYDFPPGD